GDATQLGPLLGCRESPCRGGGHSLWQSPMNDAHTEKVTARSTSMSLGDVHGPIRLHFAPGTRAVRGRWVLEEIGVPYERKVVRLSRGAHKSNDYLKIHPLGKVPALEIDGTTILESLGICFYLADRFV